MQHGCMLVSCLPCIAQQVYLAQVANAVRLARTAEVSGCCCRLRTTIPRSKAVRWSGTRAGHAKLP